MIYLTKPDGTLLERYRYDVFGTPTIRDGDGNLLPNGSAVSNRFMFTGREYAAAFKLLRISSPRISSRLGSVHERRSRSFLCAMLD